MNELSELESGYELPFSSSSSPLLLQLLPAPAPAAFRLHTGGAVPIRFTGTSTPRRSTPLFMDSRLKPFGLLFNKSLHDMIRGMRKRKDPELLAAYLRETIAECREEAKNPDLDVKAMAILKLAYLEMYGFDMTWAGFNVLEVMSSTKFQQKRIGYLAAMQTFRDPELLMMATNLLKNDLSSSSLPRVAIALSGLATIVTPLLAQDISDDILKMLNHSKPYIRKKALLAMYKVVLQYPEVFDQFAQKIKERLSVENEDPSVVSAAISVLCELANQVEPRKFIDLAPSLYELLVSSDHNWCRIKILKLFPRLCQAEPRLRTRVLPALVELMETTESMSVLYECINCCLRGGLVDEDDDQLARKCINHLRSMIETRDQNLKYVALSALDGLVRINPAFLTNDSELVIDAIDDSDPSIKTRALGMLAPLVNDDNLYEIVNRLLEQLRADDVQPDYGLLLVKTITQLCNRNNYEFLPNFEWFTEVLVEMLVLAHSIDGVGEIVGTQLQNVAVRVKSARSVVITAALNLSLNREIVKKQPKLISYTLWVIGEYIKDYFTSANAANGPEFIANILSIPPTAVAVPAVAKIFAAWIQTLSFWSPPQAEIVGSVIEDIIKYLQTLSVSVDKEVQERAAQFLELFKLGSDALTESDNSDEPPALLTVAFNSLFDGYELKPIAANAQRRIKPPADLDIDTPIKLPEVDWSASESDLSEEEPEEPIIENKRDKKMDPYYIPVQDSQPGSDTSVTPEAERADLPSSSSASASASTATTPPPPALNKTRVQRVKVEIAQDETLDLPDGSPEKPALTKPKKQSLFQLGSRLQSLELDTAEPAPKGEVVVKHKTKKKKKSKSSKEAKDVSKESKSLKSEQQ